MPNVVEISVKGNDQATQPIDRAAQATKKLRDDMKSLGGTVGNVGNIFSTFGASALGGLINQIEHGIKQTREFAGELEKSKIAVAGMAVAIGGTGFAIGDMIRKYIPFFNFHDKMETHIDQMSELEKITNEIIAARDPDLAQQREELRLIDERIEANRRLQDTVANKLTGTGSLEQQQSALQRLREATLQKQEDKEIQQFEASYARYEEWTDKVYNKLQELSDEEVYQLQQVDQAFDKRGADLLNFYQQDLLDKDQYFVAEETLFTIHQKEMTKVQKAQADARKKILDEERRKNLQNIATGLDATASMFGSLATLIQATGKKNFELAQGFRYAEAVVHTAAGIARAYADYTFPVSAIIAATVAAAGAAQIATIASAKPPQAHSGLTSVPETGTYLLKQEERVLAPEQNRDLTAFLNSGGGGGGSVMIDGRRLGEVIYAMSKDGRVKIDGRAIVQ